jgi:uncharacterized protein YbjQ (UPF0145 family)
MARRSRRSPGRTGLPIPGSVPPGPDELVPGVFTSDLTVKGFAAVRSVGFAPVGQVMGVAVINIGQTYSRCGYYLTPVGSRLDQPRWQREQAELRQQRRERLLQERYARKMPIMAVPDLQRLITAARQQAISRMRQECAALGADGVVGVRLSATPFEHIATQFCAIGTAVRATGTKRLTTPFTSDLSGPEFAVLLGGGWVPVAFVQGVGAVTTHREVEQLDQDLSWYNQELVGPTKLVQAARRTARDAVAAHAQRLGGHTVVLRNAELEVYERHCTTGEGEDRFATAYLWGTAIIPYAGTGTARTQPPLPIIRLDR